MSTEKATNDPRILDAIKHLDKRNNCIDVIITSKTDIPFIVGLLKPTIYLPDIEISDIDLRYILKHEYSHYLHRDLWVKFIIEIICSIYWWNPLIYLLKNKLDIFLEIKSDIYSTDTLDENEISNYLNALYNMAAHVNNTNKIIKSNALQLTGHSKNNSLHQRFDYITNVNSHKKNKRISILFYTFMIILFVLSYSFILQPAFLPPEYERGEIYIPSPDNSFLMHNEDGSYSLYMNGENCGTLNDISEEPFASMEIID